jgi:hypothetical protein
VARKSCSVTEDILPDSAHLNLAHQSFPAGSLIPEKFESGLKCKYDAGKQCKSQISIMLKLLFKLQERGKLFFCDTTILPDVQVLEVSERKISLSYDKARSRPLEQARRYQQAQKQSCDREIVAHQNRNIFTERGKRLTKIMRVC